MLKSFRLIRFLGILLDPKVRIPLTWPLGKYGLPMAKSGCPNGYFWRTGWRYHDTEDKDPNTIIGQTPTIWRGMLAKVTWSKSSV